MDKRLKEEIIILHAQVCKGLADPNRILILYTLNNAPYAVSDLAEALEMPQPTVSRHLKVLRERGMVAADREGESIVYSLKDQRIIAALDILRSFMADNLTNQAEIVSAAYQ
jgi:ArsR family transcriptional regulator